MGKVERLLIKIEFVLLNLVLITGLIFLYVQKYIKYEIFMASIFLVVLFSGGFLLKYIFFRKIKALGHKLDFQYVTGFLEQPRLEGMYKDNWFQLHYCSRFNGKYWGLPRTYIKLQFKNKKEFDQKKLEKYIGKFKGMKIDSLEHVKRTYKNYLLMKMQYYVTDIKKVEKLMDHLIEISKTS